MKIKNIAIWLTLLFNVAVASCQEISDEKYEIKGKVTHEDLTPVESARMMSMYIKRSSPGSFLGEPTRTKIVETDGEGKARLEFTSLPTPDGGVAFGKKGYYGTNARAIWKPAGPKSWKAEVKTVLKPVKQPIPMFAYDNTGAMGKIVKIPELNQEYGFDLMVSEALPPLGRGKTADFKFRVEGFYESRDFYNMKIFIKFTNPGDGVVEFVTPQRVGWRESSMPGSQFISDYVAPEEGYISEIVKFTAKDKQDKRTEDGDFHKNYYFRTRTVVSPNGGIISANYGKIYGDFHFQPANKDWGYIASLALIATYYNPTPNDHNVEFDPKRNLNPDGDVQKP